MITLTINGKIQEVPPDTTVLNLLDQLGIAPQLVVLEYNGEILHRQHWAITQVQTQDCLEIVTVVGGG